MLLHYYTTRRTEINDGCKVHHQVVHYQNISYLLLRFLFSFVNILNLLVRWILYHLLNNAFFVQHTSGRISEENHIRLQLSNVVSKLELLTWNWIFDAEVQLWRYFQVCRQQMFTEVSYLLYYFLMHKIWRVLKVCRNVVKIACENSWNARLRASTTVLKSSLSKNFIKSSLLLQNISLGCHTLIKVSISWVEPSTLSVLMKISEVTCHKMFFLLSVLSYQLHFPFFVPSFTFLFQNLFLMELNFSGWFFYL